MPSEFCPCRLSRKGLGAPPGTYHRNDQRNSDGQHEDFHPLHGSDSLTGLDESESRIASPSPMALKFVGVFSVGDERNATPKPRTRVGPYHLLLLLHGRYSLTESDLGQPH